MRRLKYEGIHLVCFPYGCYKHRSETCGQKGGVDEEGLEGGHFQEKNEDKGVQGSIDQVGVLQQNQQVIRVKFEPWTRS